MPPLLRVMVEPHMGGTYAQLLAIARAVEEVGGDTFFRSDHLRQGGERPRPALEAWTVLAGLARDTSRIRLGTLVSPVTFRHPAVFARECVTVDEMSGGRVEVGVGTGWFDAEHATLGIPFPPQGERTARLAEEVEVFTRLWSGEKVSFAGRFYELHDAQALPRPVQDPLPLIVGGHGGPRSVALGARHAAEYNTTSTDAAGAANTYRLAREACERTGRDPMSLRVSWMGTVLVAPDLATLRRRAAKVAEWTGSPGTDPDEVIATIAEKSVAGVYAQAAEQLHSYVEAGAERIYARIWDLDDLDQISEIAQQVWPLLA